MESLSSFSYGIQYLLFVIDVFIKYAWFKPLMNKNVIILLYGFIELINKSKRKPNKLWVDQGRKKLVQNVLGNNDLLMDSTYNESNSVVGERFIRTLKSKIYSKNDNNSKYCLGYLHKLLDEHNNSYHRSISKKFIGGDYLL